MNIGKIIFISAALTAFLFLTGFDAAYDDPAPADTGGGYAASGQIRDMGYTCRIYDASNGLPTSDANCVLAASDGTILIGGYSGIIRYDGISFTKLPVTDGLTSGRGLFEDSTGRIWTGTNDNGVVIINGSEKTHLTYKDGLPSSSIRVFAQDNDGNVYIGTTEGICYADSELKIHPIHDNRIDEERILRLDRDSKGVIYGQTMNGLIFSIENKAVKSVYSSAELGMEKITTLKADPLRPGQLYIGTDSDGIYHGKFGDTASKMIRISTAPLNGVHWLSYDCGRIWVSSINKAGYIDENGLFRLLDDVPMDSGIEMMTSDYQGNLWFASSTLGVMKIAANRFVDVTGNAGLDEEVTNVVCRYRDELYIGTDNGLRILDAKGKKINNELTELVGNARVRCMKRGGDDDLWIGTYTNGIGLIHVSSDGKLTTLNRSAGMPDDEIRCICVQKDGTVLAGTNRGLAFIRSDEVVRCAGSGEEIKNTVFLSVEEGDDGSIYVGTDGDGIYVINDTGIERIGMDEGLSSNVILRIKRDEQRGLYWIITSNSVQYLKDGAVSTVSSFPYNNNYDIFFDDNKTAWITSSAGIFTVRTGSLLTDAIADYRLYSMDNGLMSTPTAQGYGELDKDGNLYIPGRSGVCRVNVNGFSQYRPPIKAFIRSVYAGDKEILPVDGQYTIPDIAGRIRITVLVPDYTLFNPMVQVYMEGREDEGVTVARSDLAPIEYTGLDYGKYTLHLKVLDSSGKTELLDEQYMIVKKPGVWENPFIRGLLFALVVFITGFGVWRVMKSTVIRSQRAQIRQAREEAQRANAARTRFLANISHEIRTPINTIMGMNEMAMREDASDVPAPYHKAMMNYAFDIKNASETLLSLINDLLDLSRLESGSMKAVMQEYDTADMIRSVVSMIRLRNTGKDLTFDVNVDEMLPARLYGDSWKIRQILLNLLTNAIHYTEVGGFTLSVSMIERSDDECRIRFSVRDTGNGVKKEDIGKLLAGYEQLDESRREGVVGIGLGLDISRRFADLMGGSLTCESWYGKGTEFTMILPQKIIDKTPVGPVELDSGSSGDAYVPLFVAPDADVLVVDDNTMNLNVIKGLLKGTKVFVSTASGGEECIDKIKDTKFQVVLLDYMMPGMDGVETLLRIRSDHPDLPVYALTTDTSMGEEFYRAKGFTGCISKPVDGLILERTIMRHLPADMMKVSEAGESLDDLSNEGYRNL